MVPERYKAMTAGWETAELNVWDRYSINCLFFEKPLWTAINNYSNDDELMLQQYCFFLITKSALRFFPFPWYISHF